MIPVDIASLVQSILAGDLRSISRAASFIEAQTSTGREVSSTLFPNTGNALTIGITGAPGAGKSSLVNLLIAEYRAAGQQVGVIAVDPSSPYSNGALLGDRVRMLQHHADPGVFIRSMATRGRLGGLAAATLDLVLLLDAAGRRVILIETVGVGQDELDISRLAEITIVVLAPGAGDDIQALKAGILEVADIIAINKSDLPEAEGLYRDTLEAQHFVSTPHSVPALICKTSSLTGAGVPNLVDHIANCASRKGPQSENATLWSHRLRQQLRDDLLAGIPTTLLHHHAEQVAKKSEDPQSAIMALKAALLTSPNNGIEIDHLGIAVRSLDEAVPFYRDLAGAAAIHRETVEAEHVTVAMLPAGTSRIELLEAGGDESTIGRFIARRGPGLHHLAVKVDNLTEIVGRLQERGARLLNEPRAGAGGHVYVFVHPQTTGGVLLELIQK